MKFKTEDILKEKWEAIFPEATLVGNQFLEHLLSNYQAKNRHYHNLGHIAAMLNWSDEYALHLQQKEVADLAIFYHDIIYNSLRQDNEARSAKRAVRELSELGFSETKTTLIELFILATTKHDLGAWGMESDLAYFLDFDLAILGSDRTSYLNYSQQIRKEYSMYPDFLYQKGRIKVLQAFLNKASIFYTNSMKKRLETQARNNIQRELQLLQ